MTQAVRRLFYALGAADYHADQKLAPLMGVEEDLIRMTELFTREFGYEPRPPEPFLDRTAEEVRTHLVSPGDEPFSEADTVVVYYAGHGEHMGDRHYLMCPDSRRTRPTSTALPTEDLVRIFTERNARRLLLIVDTCYAARGATDAIREVAHQVALDMGRQNEAFNGRLVSFSIISAARKYQRAADSAFRTALESAIESGECGGIRSRKLLLETVVEVVSEKLKEQGHDQQDATLATLLTDRDDPPFLPNPRYDPDAPPESVSVAELRNWSRGVLPPNEKKAAAAGCFTGRTEALDHLRTWVFDTEDTSRPLAVTGAPGTGKSALLTEFRRLMETETGEPGAPPPLTVALVDARDKSGDDIVREIATAEGVAPETHYSALKALLRGRLRPFVLLVDAVGETPEAAGSPPPGHIAELLRDLAELPMMRVITAVPTALLTDLGPGEHLDLDDPRWNSEADLHAYATRLLLHPYGPGGEAIRSADEASRRARAIVARSRGNRLLIRLLAQWPAAAHQPFPDPLSPETEDRTPSADPPPIGRVFREALRARCSDDREFRTMAALLSGLAFAHGAGLPWGGRLWPRVMAKVFNNGEPLHSRDVRRLLEVAGPFLVEALDSAGRTVYRLYHETFAEELRATAPAGAREDIAEALRKELTERYLEQHDRPVDRYLRAHLPAHAADVGAVGDLLQDPCFVATTDSATIKRMLDDDPDAWQEAQAALDFVELRERGQDGITDLQLLRIVASVWQSRTMLLRLVLDHSPPLDRFGTIMTIGCTGRVAHQRMTAEDGRHRIVVETSSDGDLVVNVLRNGTAAT
ncbi:caspase family protein [Streptomyces sp. GbtcB6]|uniref:caspase family protein n=1 Tax=Streptomyces sp. GbtcB6 TaxID=2824751 RepID=UPI001C3013DB|nr:caspase family protein [Streptomyces sp. GbtcB6]